MRKTVTRAEIRVLLETIGDKAKGPGSVYLVGGTSAVLMDWRKTTTDVDLALSPEPAGLYSAIEHIKRDLNLSIELASPADFVPALPGWQGRSPFIGRHGQVDFYHFDFYTQALAKFARAHAQDLQDIRSMVSAKEVNGDLFWELYNQAVALFVYFPRLNRKSIEVQICSVFER